MNTTQKIVIFIVYFSVISFLFYVFVVYDPSPPVNVIDSDSIDELEDEVDEDIDTEFGSVHSVEGEIIQVLSNTIIVRTSGDHLETMVETDVRVSIPASVTLRDLSSRSISLSEIAVGQNVVIESSRNLRNLTNFDASHILVLETLVPPTQAEDEEDSATEQESQQEDITDDPISDSEDDVFFPPDEPDRLIVNGDQGDETTPSSDPASVVFFTSGVTTQVTSSYILFDSDGSHMTSGEQVSTRANITQDRFQFVSGYEVFFPGTKFYDVNGNEIDLSAIGVDDTIRVEGVSNIRNSTQFDAESIRLIQVGD